MPRYYDLEYCSPLVWFLPTLEGVENAVNWMVLDHTWGGFSCNQLDGWVLPVPLNDDGSRLADVICDEQWLADIGDPKYTSLDYSCTDAQRAAYVAFLNSVGLVPAAEPLRGQAVYPVASVEANLRVLGALHFEIHPNAQLLVLGQNCD